MYKITMIFCRMLFDTLGSMGNTPVKTFNKQSIIDSQDGHYTGTDPYMSPASSLDYEGM